MTPEAILTQIFSGVSYGMILFVVASGLTLVFGVMRVINFAHGTLYMIGAFLGVTLAGFFSTELFGYFGALLIVPLLVAVIGFVLEFFLFKRIYDREHLTQLLLTFGLTLIGADLVRATYGGEPYRLDRPEFLSGRADWLRDAFGLRIANYDIFLLFVGLAIGFGLWYLLQRTRYGSMIRAAVANPEMLRALGVDVDRIFTLVFMLGAWLAGIGGVLFAGRVGSTVSLGMDAQIIVQAFAIVVIGGLGSFAGALLGSLLVGITLSLGTYLPYVVDAPLSGILQSIPTEALPFLVMALVLILRPWGLLGKPER